MSKLFSIKNKVVIITGGTGVLGTIISKYLANEGAHVGILGRRLENVENLVNIIKAEGNQAFALEADVTSEASLEAAMKNFKTKFDKLDILINAAGGNMQGATITPNQTLADTNVAELKKVMELNYLGSFLPTKIFLPLFMEDKKGSIINISSMSASRPLTRVMGYSSAKAAIDNLTKWLSVEFNHKYGEGIRVNAVAPGFFLTKQNEALLTNQDGSLTERGKQIIESTPMGRFGEPDELLGAMHWLCSDASKFVTGTIIPIDGGFNAYSGV